MLFKALPVAERSCRQNWWTEYADFNPRSRLSTSPFEVFRDFLRNSRNYGRGSLRKTSTQGTTLQGTWACKTSCMPRFHMRTFDLSFRTQLQTCSVIWRNLIFQKICFLRSFLQIYFLPDYFHVMMSNTFFMSFNNHKVKQYNSSH